MTTYPTFTTDPAWIAMDGGFAAAQGSAAAPGAQEPDPEWQPL
ncbi:MAG TPA: hypothetical protein VFW82_07715 [Dyella sp.]|nr:hypothetical protein [Dyella sp.]